MTHHSPTAWAVEVRELERALDQLHANRVERDAARHTFKRMVKRSSTTLGDARRKAVKVVTDARARVHDATTSGA